MTSKKIDQYLLVLGIMLITFSTYQLFLWRTSYQSEGLSLGLLEQTTSVVKIKNASSLDWKDASSGNLLGDKQLIYTDSKSSASIKFLSGHEITIGENSLVRISALGDKSGLKVEKGFIRARIKNNVPLILSANGSEFKLTAKDADVQIDIQGSEFSVGVISGEVSVGLGSQVEVLNKTKSLKLEAGALKLESVTISQSEPLPGEAIYTPEETRTVFFKWAPESEGEVLVADNSSLKKARVFRGNGVAHADLSPGTYYWRVEDGQGKSMTRTFTVLRETALQVLRPVNGGKIVTPRDGKIPTEVYLQWKGKKGESYLVEWSELETHRSAVKAPGLLIPLTRTGSLNWRVKVDSPERPEAIWSDWQNVDVTVIDVPSVPENLSPKELELQAYTKEEYEIDLKWVMASSVVELEIMNPKNERFFKVLDVPNHVHKVSGPGIYRWRVRGLDQFQRVSDWSEWGTFTLVDLSGEISKEGYQRVVLKKPDQSVTFSWEAEEGTTTVFELSTTEQFSEVIIKKNVPGKDVNVVIPQIGNYFWRSRQFKSDGTINISEPRKVIIEKAPAPTKPEKMPDLNVPLNWEETSQKPKSKWWSFFISEAYADTFKGVAKISLPENEDAKKYVVKIFSDFQGSDLILEETVESKVFTWSGVKPGQYYWQYALIDYWGRQSPFSDISQITVTGIEPVNPEVPTLLTPLEGEVLKGDFRFSWTPSKKNKDYRVDVSPTKDFKLLTVKKAATGSTLVQDHTKLIPGTYFWRVKAFSETKKQVVSLTSSFALAPDNAPELPPIEKITFIDKPEADVKVYSKRVSLAWAPSMDTFDLEGNNEELKIEGNALNSVEAQGIYFTKRIILSLDFLRQSGKVFESETYLFQRLALRSTWRFNHGNHIWGPGVSVGSASGYSYENINSQISSKAISGLIYGPHLEGFYTLTPAWELRGRTAYMLGAIPHLEVSGEVNRQFNNFYFLFGAAFGTRDYVDPDGSQRSVRLSLGLGKNF